MKTLIGIVALVLICQPIVALAADSVSLQTEGEMPPIGAPAEMQELAFLEGTWTHVGRARMDDSTDQWTEFTGTCVYHYVAGGAAMASECNSRITDMELRGFGVQTYDREKGEWQQTWVDNMAGRNGIYTGYKKDDRMVLLGEDRWMGQVFLSRLTTYDETPVSFKLRIESSKDGGKTWTTGMESTYTKQ